MKELLNDWKTLQVDLPPYQDGDAGETDNSTRCNEETPWKFQFIPNSTVAADIDTLGTDSVFILSFLGLWVCVNWKAIFKINCHVYINLCMSSKAARMYDCLFWQFWASVANSDYPETVLYDSTQWDLSLATKISQIGPCIQILWG